MSDETAAAAAPDLGAIVGVLNQHGVHYVVIGGAAAQMFVAGLVTFDVDVAPAADRENLRRLSAALRELGARVRTSAEPDGLPFDHDGASLGRSRTWNLQCRFGAFDIAFEPAGGGYETLADRARVVRVRGVDVPVAALEDVVRSKELAGRPKDLAVLPLLRDALTRLHHEPNETPLPGHGA